MSELETALKLDIIRAIKASGGDAFHLSGSIKQRGGEPDISGEYPSGALGAWVHLKLEVKRPGERPTRRQLYRLGWYHRAGYVAGVVTSVADLQKLLKAYQNRDGLATSGLPFAEEIYA